MLAAFYTFFSSFYFILFLFRFVKVKRRRRRRRGWSPSAWKCEQSRDFPSSTLYNCKWNWNLKTAQAAWITRAVRNTAERSLKERKGREEESALIPNRTRWSDQILWRAAGWPREQPKESQREGEWELMRKKKEQDEIGNITYWEQKYESL